MSKPNIIIIMADQLRYDVLGEFTPNINKLKNEGISFNNAYCACPLCVPARGAFFTGTYPNENGSIINPWEKLEAKHGDVKEGLPNLFTLLENEYDSWHVGKQHFLTEEKIHKSSGSKTHWLASEHDYKSFVTSNNKRRPGGKAFSSLCPEMSMGTTTRAKRYSIPKTGCYEEDVKYFFDGYFTDNALTAIKQRDKDKPLMLNLMYLAPHPPLNIPEPWYSRVKQVTLPENVGVWYKNQSPLQLYNLTGALGSKYTREEWYEVWRVYLGLVSLLDDQVGRVIESLKSEGLYDNSIIIFTADHGEMLGSHCLWQKMCMYEESVKTPLIIKFPKGFSQKSKTIEQPISSIDLLPTLCEYTGIKIPETVSGSSLLPLINKEKTTPKDIFIQFDGNGARGNFQRCIIKDGYKLIADIFKDEIYFELYSQNDPLEKENLAFSDKYKDKVNEMLNLLINHMQKTGDLISIYENAYENFINSYKKFTV